MCVYSMIMDHYEDRWRRLLADQWVQQEYQPYQPYPAYPVPATPLVPPKPQPPSAPVTQPAKPVTGILPVSQEEVEEFRRLLERAREYDRRHREPECEDAEKKRRVRELAERLGLKVDFID